MVSLSSCSSGPRENLKLKFEEKKSERKFDPGTDIEGVEVGRGGLRHNLSLVGLKRE